MSASHVRRGAPARPKQKPAPRISKRTAASHARANRIAGLSGLFFVAQNNFVATIRPIEFAKNGDINALLLHADEISDHVDG